MRGRTALMHACVAPFHQNHPEVVQMLLAKGAEVNAKSKLGRTTLGEASILGHREIQKMLITAWAKKSWWPW